MPTRYNTTAYIVYSNVKLSICAALTGKPTGNGIHSDTMPHRQTDGQTRPHGRRADAKGRF